MGAILDEKKRGRDQKSFVSRSAGASSFEQGRVSIILIRDTLKWGEGKKSKSFSLKEKKGTQ